MDLFSDNGFKAFYGEHPEGHRANCFYRQHIEERSLLSLKVSLERGYPLIVPLRHPELCAQSWAKRRKPIDVMLQQWHWLIDIVAAYNPMYLPIDSPDKKGYLKRIGERLSVPLRTNWEIVGAKCVTVTLEAEDVAKVRSFVRSAKFKETLGSIYPDKP